MMRLRTKYILFVTILHIVALLLSYFIFRENEIVFIISEVFIIISIILAWQLYNQLIQPLKLLMQGTEAIKDKDFNVKFLPTGKHEMDQLIRVYNEMMDELRTERTKQEQQHLFLEKLIYTSPTGILVMDYDEQVRQANPKAMQLLEMPEKEIIGKSTAQLTHPIMRQITQLESGQSKTFTSNGGITYKLQKSHFIDRGFQRHFILIEELTAEILDAEKRTYGKVIRMMAHEVNNTIGPVNSILQFTLKSQQHSEALTDALKVAMERNNNLNLFVRNFADLVRIPMPAKKTLDLVPLLQNVADLMRLKAAEDKTSFQFELSNPSFIITADEHQLEQVLINIIKNAQEAIEEKGLITISTHDHPRQLVIRDTGKGISPESEKQLFSPFFSTKKDGQGIGLTLIREILLNHGFEFTLKTIDTGHTEFRINFE